MFLQLFVKHRMHLYFCYSRFVWNMLYDCLELRLQIMWLVATLASRIVRSRWVVVAPVNEVDPNVHIGV